MSRLWVNSLLQQMVIQLILNFFCKYPKCKIITCCNNSIKSLHHVVSVVFFFCFNVFKLIKLLLCQRSPMAINLMEYPPSVGVILKRYRLHKVKSSMTTNSAQYGLTSQTSPQVRFLLFLRRLHILFSATN